MQKFYTCVVRHRKLALTLFVAAFLVCLSLQRLVAVNYEIHDYLPADAHSTVSGEVMREEFQGGIPNARVMVRGVTIPQALEYKASIQAVDGVTAVTWLDDAADITVPLSMLDADTVRSYYKEDTALFTVTIDDVRLLDAVAGIRQIIGPDNAMTGNAISTAAATESTVAEVRMIAIFAVLFVFAVLLLTTRSWLEPLLVLGGLGIAIVINNGTNLIFGEISFVTNAAGSILQLAVSLDYSVFLIHRFEECREDAPDAQSAMVDALCKSTSSILSSGLTTVIGFLALVLMRFGLGPDLGLALAKGVAIGLVTVFFFMPSLILMAYRWMDKTRHRALVPSFRWFGRTVRRISIPMVGVFAVVLVPAYLASNANTYEYGASGIFGPETQYGADTAAIEEVFGRSDTYVLMVPKEDMATQRALSRELQALDHVTGILSYVDTVGAEIPLSYLDEGTRSQLISEHYSRMVLSVDVPAEGEATFSLVEQMRATAEKYYPGSYYLAGQGVSTYDLKQTVTADMIKVNLLAIAAVYVVLVLTLRSLFLPLILVLSIETAIWLNLSIPYFMGSPVYYIAYLIISAVQLGATVDYAILVTDRYRENRRTLEKKAAVVKTISDVTVSILTSGSALTVVGLLMGYISSNRLLAQLGIFIGRGALFSLAIVLLVLPGLLMMFDKLAMGRKWKQEANAR